MKPTSNTSPSHKLNGILALPARFVLFTTSLFMLAMTAAQAEIPRSMWVWDAENITDTSKRSDLINFCVNKGITTLFISTGNAFVDPEDPAYPSRHPVSNPQLGQFNMTAHDAGIAVYALDGDATFCLNSQHERALGRLQKAMLFNYNQALDARLDGFEWDIEPHRLEAWAEASNQQRLAYLNGLLTVAEKLTDEADSAIPEIRIGFAIPFWYDNPEYVRSFNGIVKETSSHMFDIVATADESNIAIMAYRDTASASYSLAYDEYEYAKQNTPGVKIWHGLETGPFSPSYITFHEEGETYLESSIQSLDNYLDAYQPPHADTVAGIAIHAYKYYNQW